MEISIDTASPLASLAVSRQGRLVAELTWHCQRNHSVEVLPALEGLLSRTGISQQDLTAVFVCVGPGSYAGLRVGVSIAKGLAFALSIPLVGVGRLEVDAYPHAAYPGPICPVHAAGRGQWAWAIYQKETTGFREVVPPRLATSEELVAAVPAGSLLCGEVSPQLAAAAAAQAKGLVLDAPAAAVRRAGYLAELAWTRLAAGHRDDPARLRPLYLRAPAIGPQVARS